MHQKATQKSLWHGICRNDGQTEKNYKKQYGYKANVKARI